MIRKGVEQPSAAEHPAVQAALGPLLALLPAEPTPVEGAGFWVLRSTIEVLATDHPANQSLIGAEPGAITKLCQRRYWFALAAVVKGHGINQSRLIAQDGFMDKLMDVLASKGCLFGFNWVAAALSQDNPEFTLQLCNTPTAVPLLTGALLRAHPECFLGSGPIWDTILALLLSRCKARPSTVHTISSQPGVADRLQQVSANRTPDGKQRYPDAASLLELVWLLN